MAEPILPSPNIWYWPEIYEIENRAQDVHGAIWAALREECDWAGRDVLDVGCGDGFHLPVFAAAARSVLGVEPYQPLVRRARDRVAEWGNVAVLAGGAGRLPVPDASVDLVHARTAYFFGRGCEPGMAEADRVLRPGGALAIVDLDVGRAPYGDWMRADLLAEKSSAANPADVEAFFAEQGFRCRKVLTEWRFPDAASLAAVLRIEFSARVAEWAIAEVTGLSIPVGYRIHVREKPTGLLVP